MSYKDKYPNIVKANLSIEDIAHIFKYKTSSALRNSSKYHTLLEGVDNIIGIIMEQIAAKNKLNKDKLRSFMEDVMSKVDELS